jgi:flagellar basal-body rod modification protein FlgD
MIQGFVPALSAPLKAQNANATAAQGNSASTTSSSSSSLQDTFLNLLVTELQNQDPTSPVDPTAMVGQMVSLNQLDQLISINQTLQNLGSGTATTPAAGATSKSSSSPTAVSVPAAAPSRISLPAASASNLLTPPNIGYADKTSLMNLYGSLATPTSTLNSTISGGK